MRQQSASCRLFSPGMKNRLRRLDPQSQKILATRLFRQSASIFPQHAMLIMGRNFQVKVRLQALIVVMNDHSDRISLMVRSCVSNRDSKPEQRPQTVTFIHSRQCLPSQDTERRPRLLGIPCPQEHDFCFTYSGAVSEDRSHSTFTP